MLKRRVAFCGVAAAAFFWTQHAFASSAYFPGEELVYRVYYGPVPAGVVRMGVSGPESIDGETVIGLFAEATSSPPFSYFYRVRNRLESYVDSETLLPLRFEKIRREASFRKERSVHFDRNLNMAKVTGGGKNTSKAIPENAQDYLSSLFYLRGMDLVPGESMYFDATSGDANYRVRVMALRKEPYRKWGRDLDAIVVHPVVEDFKADGIMRDRPDMFIWLTDDDRRIPLKIEVNTNFGRLDVVLINYTQGEPASEKRTGNQAL